MTFTCKHLTCGAERALKVDFRAYFREWRKMGVERRAEVVDRFRQEAGLDETDAGVDMEIAANILEALSKACERRKPCSK